jgi:hypothetical protein
MAIGFDNVQILCHSCHKETTMFIVHLYYSGAPRPYYMNHQIRHMVRCPDGSGKIFTTFESLSIFLHNRNWRYAT